MPKFIVKKKAEIISEFELDKPKPIYFIGSDIKNDFVISDNKVSIKHLKIQNIDNHYYIEDLNSAFGTLLNGNPVNDRVQIFNGDEVGIGSFSLVFEYQPDRGPAAKPKRDEFIEIIGADDFIKKNDAGPEDLKPVAFEDDASIEAISEDSQPQEKEFYQFDDVTEYSYDEIGKTDTQTFSPGDSYYLLTIDGPNLGKKYALKKGDTKIGRDTSLNDIVIRHNLNGTLDPSISRRHATISFRNEKYYISDKRSKTRTFVNQIKLGTEEELPIRERDEIEIVSDQKSTIFRLVRDGEYDISPPKKTGEWWTRNRFNLGVTLTILLGCITLGSLGLSCRIRLANADKPDNLKLIEETWRLNEAGTSPMNGPINQSMQQANLAVADLNGDKKVDLVFVDNSGRIVALDGTTKRSIWEYSQGHMLQSIPLVLSDLNSNKLPDILAVSQDSRLLALDGVNGAEIWFSPILGARLSGPPVVADFNGDGTKDVLICAENGQINLGHGGLWDMSWQTIETGLTLSSVPSSSDWDSDGIHEIFVGSDEGKVVIINGQSGEITMIFDFSEEVSKATGNISGENKIQYPIALTDLNNDNTLDLIIGATNGNYLALAGRTLSRLWFKPLPAGPAANHHFFAPAVGQFDDDDIPDVALVSNNTIKVIKSGDRGQTLWEHSLSDDTFNTPPTLTDIDRDGITDILIASQSGSVFVFSGKDGRIISQTESGSNPVRSSIVTADMGENGYLDALFIREDGHIHKIQSNSPISENSVTWGQSYANAQNTSEFDYIQPKSTTTDIMMATFGIMFFVVGFLTFSANQKRKRLINFNQHV